MTRAVALLCLLLAACSGGANLPQEQALPPALKAWAGFPIHASPRPIVLIGSRIDGPRAFATGEQKMAFSGGAIRRPDYLPAGPATFDGYPIVSADRAYTLLTSQGSKPSGAAVATQLTITDTWLGKATFETDRGDQPMPAWMFTMTGADGPVAVLAVAPGAEWFPAGLASDRAGEPYWAGAVVGSDHRTLTVGLIGAQSESGPCGERYEVKLTESSAAVMVTLIRHPDLTAARQSPPVVCTLMGFLRHASARLKAPLGGRVLIDDLGYPIGAGGNP